MTYTVYSGRVTNWRVLLFGVSGVGIFVLLSGYRDPLWIALSYVVLGVPYLMMTSVSLTVGPKGVVVRRGVLGLPRTRIGPSSIAGADVIDVPRSLIGSASVLWTKSSWRSSACIRYGRSLDLHLTNGGHVVITTVDPDAAASLANAYAGGAASAGREPS